MDTQPRQWWRKKRWQAALLLWIVAAYPASIGPVEYVAGLHFLSQATADAYRDPAERLLPRFVEFERRRPRLVRPLLPHEGDVLVPDVRPNPWTSWFWSYVDWWDELGRQHAGL